MGGQESALQVYGHADFPRKGELVAFPGGRTVVEQNRLGLQSGDFVERSRTDQKEGRVSSPEVWYHPSTICVDAEGTKWEVCVMRATTETARVKCRPLPQDSAGTRPPVLPLQQVLDWAVAGRACGVVAKSGGVFEINI